MKTTERECLNCGKAITGRIDKKYCNPACRTDFHNGIAYENSSSRKKEVGKSDNASGISPDQEMTEIQIKRAHLWKVRMELIHSMTVSGTLDKLFQMLYLMDANKKTQLPFHVLGQLEALSQALPSKFLLECRAGMGEEDKIKMEEIKNLEEKIKSLEEKSNQFT